MGVVRTCDARCHNAKELKCVCWCRGLFHGAGGEEARQTFRDSFGDDIPATEEAIGQAIQQGDLFSGGAERFARAIHAAKLARASPSGKKEKQSDPERPLTRAELHREMEKKT